jgi:hypothetical protein
MLVVSISTALNYSPMTRLPLGFLSFLWRKRGGVMAAQEPPAERSARASSWLRHVVTWSLVVYPVLYGALATRTWLVFSTEVYTTLAQTIAAFFIAVSIDLFAGPRSGLLRGHFLFTTYLLAASWTGFFACVRAIIQPGSPLTIALSMGGLCAAAVAVSVALAERIKAPNPLWRDRIVAILVAPMLVLLFF